MSCWHPYTHALLVYWCSYRMAVKSVFPYCVRTMHILPNLITYIEHCYDIMGWRGIPAFLCKSFLNFFVILVGNGERVNAVYCQVFIWRKFKYYSVRLSLMLIYDSL